MDPKTITLRYANGTESEHTLPPMPVARFEAAWAFTGDRFNELRLLDLAFNQGEGWSKGLSPESYTAATEAMYAVDTDFFASVARRAAWRAAMTGATS
jgi:hypothetical protein